MTLFKKTSKATLLIITIVLTLASCATSTHTGIRDQNDPFHSSYSLENRLQLANEAYSEGRLVDAERMFLNIVFKHRNLTDAWFKLGNIYYRSGRYKASVNAYETVLKHDSNFERAWYNLALSRISQSVETLDMAITNLPVDSPLNFKAQRLKARYTGGMRRGRDASNPASDDITSIPTKPKMATKKLGASQIAKQHAKPKKVDIKQISEANSFSDIDSSSK